MLIEFRVANFRSIRDPQVLSLVASSGDELPHNICACDSDPDMQLVRSAVIYGANAGGKSNLIRALWFMRQFILHSAKESQRGEEIPVDNFRFEKKFNRQPSQFEITFSKNNIRYQYGFMADKTRIYEEWLNAYPSNHMQKWFSRKYDTTINKDVWKFSKFFTGKKQSWTEQSRSNALFLSTAIQLNNEQLTPIFDWFQKDLIVIPLQNGISINKTISELKKSEGKMKIMKYMNIVDPSISDISVNYRKFSVGPHYKDHLKDIFKEEFLNKNKDVETPELIFTHVNETIMSEKEQSHGTQMFFNISGYWIDALENGKVLVIDELDSGLHPLSVRFLIELMYNSDINKNKAQLVFSTHDTSQLDNDIFRRDQVWFVEKDKNSSTHLYPLLDFSPRKDENIGRGYLRGRYGAIPYIGEWRF
ncbi:MAG: hypothetical protein K0R48_1215 [Gammaproteobacteria bacterium]|jgi:AAA15 family ATPase/GTPase|nr:hypothetical protein [Gammaproteobacteria bacterium]